MLGTVSLTMLCYLKLLTLLNRELDFSLPRLFAPGSESSRCGPFAPWNFRTLELSLPGTFAPWNFRSLVLSLPLANKARNGSVVNCN